MKFSISGNARRSQLAKVGDDAFKKWHAKRGRAKEGGRVKEECVKSSKRVNEGGKVSRDY